MCGICLLLRIALTSNDLTIINEMINYYNSFEDKPKDYQSKGDIKEEEKIISLSNNNQIQLEVPFDYTSFSIIEFKETIELIHNRGPEYLNISSLETSTVFHLNEIPQEKISLSYKTYHNVINYLTETNNYLLISSVLSLRGCNNLTKQPIYHENESNNILQYNGEIFSIGEQILPPGSDIYKDNDGEILYNILNNLSIRNKGKDIDTFAKDFFNVINQIESDHAFIFYDNNNKRIIVNRDIFAKRSLILIYIKTLNLLLLSSVIPHAFYLQRNSTDVYIVEIPNNTLLVIEPLTNSNKLTLFKNPFIPTPSSLRFNPISNFFIEDYSNLTNLCSNHIKEAVYKRIMNLPSISSYNQNSQDSIGVLFSGGIDSLLLSYYSILNVPEYITIDLLNLSFDKLNAPDRNSGIIGYRELLLNFPNRKINLILIEKNYNELINGDMQKKVLNLIYPRETIMDFNISTAMKFASLKKGYLVDKIKMMSYFDNNPIDTQINELSYVNKNNYNNNILSKQLCKINYESFTDMSQLVESKAKILLSGLGADEFFGGYSRYRNGDITSHMSKDIDRIWMRNFGRDDRACSDNGIELRFPFFDLKLIKFLSQIKDISQCTNFGIKRGIGEKLLLRNVAKTLGFGISATFEKRAIQFGTRLAHEMNMHTYGSNRKANGKAQYKINK